MSVNLLIILSGVYVTRVILTGCRKTFSTTLLTSFLARKGRVFDRLSISLVDCPDPIHAAIPIRR